MNLLASVSLSTDPDSVSWALEGLGIFSSYSLYLKHNQGASVAYAKISRSFPHC
jgi:hypothetical protein